MASPVAFAGRPFALGLTEAAGSLAAAGEALSLALGGGFISSSGVLCAPRGSDLSPAITRPLGGLTPKHYKQWSVQPKGVGSVFARQNILLSVARALTVHLSQPLDTWFRECLEAEKHAEENNLPQPALLPFPDLAPHKTHVYNSLIQDLSTQVLRRWMEEECFMWVDTRNAWKLLKDVKASAMRKAERGLSWLQLTAGVAKTAFRATALGYLSEAIVRQTILLFRCWKANQMLSEATGGGTVSETSARLLKEASLPWLSRQTAYLVVHVSLRAVAGNIILGAMASSHPKYGCLVGQSFNIGDSIVGFVVQSYLMPWAEQ
mmetsp:Transcript_16155/g.45011  ORF Transcript_16155/g.45011 Transcript_16155/m.45011 type:complete len:320 (+) Transcript_16155:213-1172(+)